MVWDLKENKIHLNISQKFQDYKKVKKEKYSL
jgi:hypothetical protein